MNTADQLPLNIFRRAQRTKTTQEQYPGKLFHYFVVLLDEEAREIPGSRPHGPYGSLRKADVIANRLNNLQKAQKTLPVGASWEAKRVQYAGEGTLPENRR